MKTRKLKFKKWLSFIFSIAISMQVAFGQVIIVDHTVVDKYDDIPQKYIDSVKKMWVNIPGESHSLGVRIGCQILDTLNKRFNISVRESGTPQGYTDTALRISRATWCDISRASGWDYGYGEEDWYTSALAIERTKSHIAYANMHNLEIAAIGFGWCWDMTWLNNPGGTVDPVYQVKWAGSSVGGQDGNKIWGLDKDDSVLTGNRICMDTYLKATLEYINYCKTNNYKTKVFFTTGPVDNYTGESGYQRHIKHEYIRNYVKNLDNAILFDYADILCWNNNGQQQTTTWTDYGGKAQTYPIIHNDNMQDINKAYSEDGDHIGQVGALRLAKALWWMLARVAGWSGTAEGTDILPPSIPQNLTATVVSSSQIDLLWGASTDNISVSGYEIYRNGNLLTTTTDTSYSNTGLIANTQYSYTVLAYDAAGNKSAQSQAAQATTLPSAQTTDHITQYGITWTFDKAYSYGQFVNGDYWVVGPITITGMGHNNKKAWDRYHRDSVEIRENYVGTMVNPRAIESQGYQDSSTNYNRNLDYSTKLPFTVDPGSSVVSTTALKAMAGGEGQYLADAVVLTIVDAPQTPDKFRPPYTRPTRASNSSQDPLIFSTNDIHWDLLPCTIPVPANAPLLSHSERLVERVWLDHYLGEFMSSRIHPLSNMQGYGRDIAADVSEVAVQLMLNYSNAEKEKLVIRTIQLGIDLYGCYLDGRIWYAAAGHNSGRKFPIVFAGLMLDNEAIKTMELYVSKEDSCHRFGEDGQTYYYDDSKLPAYGWYNNDRLLQVSNSPGANMFQIRGRKGWIDRANGGQGDIALWSSFDYAGKMGNPAETYVYEILDVNDWPSGADGGHDSPQRSENYRSCCTSRQWVGYAMALRIMGPDAVKVWGHDAFFDYVYRFMEEDDTKAAAAYNTHFTGVCTFNQAQRSSGSDFIDYIWKNYGHAYPLLRQDNTTGISLLKETTCNVFPNPFKNEIKFSITIPSDANISIDIYDIYGRKIKNIHEGKLVAGNHQLTWNGTDANNGTVSPGVYLCIVSVQNGGGYKIKLLKNI